MPRDPQTSPRRAFPVRRVISLLVALLVLILPWFVEFPGLSPAGHRLFGIFLSAIVLWVTEPIPLHATAALIILLEILLISDKALVAVPGDFDAPAFAQFYHALAHPVLMLFLGGFFLANGAARFKLDRNIARVLLRPFGQSPKMIMLGLMLITAAFSMFMSNTATTATMMAVILPVIASLPPGDRLRTGLALCIPIAANVGGIGTPVGTPPNAIALGALSSAGISISFAGWMAMMVPCMLLLLVAAWLLMARLYPSSTGSITLQIDSVFDRSRPAWIFYVTFAATVLLWLTEPLHGIESSVVGFVPVAVLLSTGVFSARDLQGIQWDVLWLVGGGIALGTGISTSGLDAWLINLVQWDAIGPALLGIALCVAALLMSTVISNSATANLLVPIGISLAVSGAVDISPTLAGVFIAVGASLAMALPISTPPNAIAYSSGMVTTRNMATMGAMVGAIGLILFTLVAPWTWQWLGFTAP